MCHSHTQSLGTLAAAVLAALAAAPGVLRADYLDDIGFNLLKGELGGALPDGSGIRVAQAELKVSSNYLPQPGSGTFAGAGNFSGKTFTAESPGGSGASSHAASVADYFYGNNTDPALGPASMAPGVTEISSFGNLHYLDGGYGAIPDRRVHCNAWVDLTPAASALINLDAAIDERGYLSVAGLTNGPGPVNALLASAYNVLTVGRSDGNHAGGGTPASLPGPGRMKPEVVAPYGTTSFATAGVSSMAVLLYDWARSVPELGPAFLESEVMKAIIMAGATKDEFPGWSRTETAPLDAVYGAGEVNVRESHRILVASEQSSGGGVGQEGWDFGELPAEVAAGQGGPPQDYTFTVPPGMLANEVSIVLAWNRFGAAGTVHDMYLQLLNAAETVEWDASRSPVDNVEHIHYRNLPEGDYIIRVRRKGHASSTTKYGLAWRIVFGHGPEIASAPSGDDILLSFSQLDPRVAYTIERSSGGNSWSFVEAFTPAGTTHASTDPGAAGGGFSYRLDWSPVSNGTPPVPDDGGDPPSGSVINPCVTPGINCPDLRILPPGGSHLEMANLEPNEPCTIEKSLDLRSWAEVHRFVPAGTTFSWTDRPPGGGEQYYRLKGAAVAGPGKATLEVTPPAGTTLQFSGLEPGVTYRIERGFSLKEWDPVHEFTAPDVIYEWLHQRAGGRSLFYRLRWHVPGED